MARGNRFQHPNRSRRLTQWGVGPNIVDGAASGNQQTLWTTGSVVVDKVTITRIRGFIHLLIKTSDAVGGGFRGALGIGLVSDQAFAAGATSMPGPLTDMEWDGWIWHHFFDIRTVTATIADGVNAVGASQRIEIDSKAMRRQDPNQTMFGMFEVAESANATAELQGDTRILDKLS